MSLSAIDCVTRGVSNFRANWELALVQFAQVMICSVLTLIGLVGLIVMLGASFLFQIDNSTDWLTALERLDDLAIAPGLLAIGLVGGFILTTIILLIYSWFQAGIFGVLDAGERQAPVTPGVDAQLFRTFRWHLFTGWASKGVWRFFGYLTWTTLVATVIALVVVLALALGMVLIDSEGGPVLVVVGCLAVLPLILFFALLNLWIMLGMALLSREEMTAMHASAVALRIVRRRLPGLCLIGFLFFLVYFGVALVFWPLTQGMVFALQDSAVAAVVVQLLLGAAQSLVGSLIMVSFFGALTALARSELKSGNA